MLNKDKRSLVLCLALGDGCLHYIRNNGKLYGGITIDHGMTQADYQAWKAKLLSEVFNKEVKLRSGHKGQSVQISVCAKRLRAWRKFCYPNNHKSLPKLLKFIRHPELALSVLLMDDGYVEPGISTLATGIKKCYAARFRIFLCDQTEEELKEVNIWLKTNFDIESKTKHMWDGRQNKYYPFIRFSQADSLKLWKNMREFVLQFKSMQYKFRYIEQIFQSKCLQPQTSKKNLKT